MSGVFIVLSFAWTLVFVPCDSAFLVTFIPLIYSAGAQLDKLDSSIKEFCETNRSSLKPLEHPRVGTKGVSKFGDTFFRCKVKPETIVIVVANIGSEHSFW